MASCVGPAVMSTCLPAMVLGVSAYSAAATRTSISCIRPLPVVPQANSPLAASSMVMLLQRDSSSMAFCVAGDSYMLVFIAGAITTGFRIAAKVVVSASSAMPLAILQSTFAVAGAMIIRSAHSGREMCSVLCSLIAAKTSE